MKPYYEEAGITIYHGDCREVLPLLCRADSLITDPPWGVEFTGKITKHFDKSGGESYVDDSDHFSSVILPAVQMALRVSTCAAIFTGTRHLQAYPTPTDIGGIVCPNGGGRSSWGFGCFHPIAYYGTSPYLRSGQGGRPTATVMYHPGMHVTGEVIDHPCPKPIAFMKWLVKIASMPGDSILDPFMGSGTTLRAAKDLGRRAIGIEIEERYCEIAAKRLSQGVLAFCAPIDSGLAEPQATAASGLPVCKQRRNSGDTLT